MNKRPSVSSGESRRLEAAVRRAVGVRFMTPSLRARLRACSVYANVIAAAVALGIPTVSGLRSAAGSAILSFESAVRSAREAASGVPDMLSTPTDLSEVVELTPLTADAPVPSEVVTPPVTPSGRHDAPVRPDVVDMPVSFSDTGER